MAKTPSKMIPLGTHAPEFMLPDAVSGRRLSLNDLKGEVATVIMFICNHCPFVKHMQSELAKLPKPYISRGVSFIAINSNDAIGFPEDRPERMKEVAKELGYSFPYLYDESQEVAKNYDAACTPDFYIFDSKLSLVYRGQFDDSRPDNNIPVTGADIRAALDSINAGISVSAAQKPSIGCNIKWKQ